MTFGSVITAMVTPFGVDGKLDVAAIAPLANHLVNLGNDGIVVNGTTGESATVDDDEKLTVLQEVINAVGGKAKVIAGVGSNDTAHSIRLAKDAKRVGADASLIVTPYYNKPSADGLYAHFIAVTEATDLPVMIYDIPGRSAIAIPKDVMMRLAEHPLILANKDARADLPMLSIGAHGFVSVCGHLVADRLQQMRDAFVSGNVETALKLNQDLVPVYTSVMSTIPGVMAVKAALSLQGHLKNVVRLPLVPANEKQITELKRGLTEGGISL